MSRKILLAAALIVFSAVFVQGQSANQSSVATPATGPFGGPILVTPTATLPTPAPVAGISDAGRAGFSSVASAPVEPAYLTNSANAGAVLGSVSTTIAPNAEQPRNDLGPSVSVNGGSESAAPAAYSVVEASGRYKAGGTARNARVLSNEDVDSMLSRKGGVTMAKNMPPLGPGALEQGGKPQNAGVQPSQQGTQSSTAANQGQKARETPPVASEATAANATTPQINPNQQSNDAQGSRRLPATATFLPLFGLLGLASGGIGLWFRKFRK